MKYNHIPKSLHFFLFFQWIILIQTLQQCIAYIHVPLPSAYNRRYYGTTTTTTATAANSDYHISTVRMRRPLVSLSLLSDKYLENDLVSIRPPPSQDVVDSGAEGEVEGELSSSPSLSPILCVVRPDGGVHPLCTHEDDNENDLFIYPKLSNLPWTYETINDDDVLQIYGEGWYGQRVVPSLGGGPGYGAEADDVWTVDEEVLELVRGDGVDVPVLDLGIAHGEKARGGAI
mmetsp:Transcript_14186/g.17919  ORF Transcript_14186/g.17919 Transcript_14186/m.17919 type:complete len:231 (-) Transcript_14186:161-853(-)